MSDDINLLEVQDIQVMNECNHDIPRHIIFYG